MMSSSRIPALKKRPKMPSWGEVLERIEESQKRVGVEAYDVVRNHYLDKLQEYTGRDTILYSTAWTVSQASSANQSIDNTDIHGFMEALSGLDDDELDLILHSQGGQPEAAEQIVEYLRAKYDEIRVFVPHSARSAATLICCAADEIHMGAHSSLGPVDPQMSMQTPLGPRLVPAQSILDQFDEARDDFQDDKETGHWVPLIRQYGPSLLKECEDAIDYSGELVERWASEYMFSGDDADERAEKLARILSERQEHKSHSRPIMRSEAEDIGFNVKPLEDDDELQDRVLSVFHAAYHTHAGTSAIKIIQNSQNNAFVVMSQQSEETDDS